MVFLVFPFVFIIDFPNQFRVFHWPWFSLFFIGFPQFPHFFVFVHWFFLRLPLVLHFHHLFQLFVAIVALLVLAAAIAVVDRRHDGFKIKKAGKGLGGGRSASPPRRWEDLDVAPLCLAVVP